MGGRRYVGAEVLTPDFLYSLLDSERLDHTCLGSLVMLTTKHSGPFGGKEGIKMNSKRLKDIS